MAHEGQAPDLAADSLVFDLMRRRQRQGTGTARQRGNRWEIRIFVDGRRLSVYGATQEEAQRKADAAKQQRRRTGQAPTVRDWLAEWLQLRRDQVRPQTWLSYEAHARLHIVPAIGPVRLDALTPEHLDRLHTELARKVGGTTAHHVHMTLSAALNVAARRGLPVSSAIHAVSPPRRVERAIVTLSPAEVDRLLAAAVSDPRSTSTPPSPSRYSASGARASRRARRAIRGRLRLRSAPAMVRRGVGVSGAVGRREAR